MPAFMESVKKLSPKGWAVLGGSLVAGIAFLMIVMSMTSQPSYSTLMAGIDPTQTGKIESTLSAQGVSYQLQNNGTAIAVQSGQTAQARVALATAGLLTNQQPGFSLLNNSSLGQSNFQQQVTYERALEGQLFSNNTQPATASVLLGSSGVSAGQVRGIAQLVASSVPGLSVNKVTITGPDGSLLWPNGNSDGSSGGLLAAQSASQKYDSTMAGVVDAMLAQTLGPGKAQVMINANV